MSVTLGVIVAGGRGRRLGLGIPKAMARLGGMTLLDRAIATLAPWCETIVVAAPPECPIELPARDDLASGGLRDLSLVADVVGAACPLAGVVAGLQSRRHERALVLGVDFPLMRSSALGALLERLDRRGAVLPVPGGVPQPLASAYGSAAGPIFARALESGERSISSAVRALDPLLLGDAEIERLPGGLESFLNLNTPADRERAEALLRSREPLEGAA